eukprot:3006697-Prymnesium_polylepis.1
MLPRRGRDHTLRLLTPGVPLPAATQVYVPTHAQHDFGRLSIAAWDVVAEVPTHSHRDSSRFTHPHWPPPRYSRTRDPPRSSHPH